MPNDTMSVELSRPTGPSGGRRLGRRTVYAVFGYALLLGVFAGVAFATPSDLASRTRTWASEVPTGVAHAVVVRVGSDPLAVVINPSGRYAYVANSGSDSISVVNLVKSTVTATIAIGHDPDGLAVSPNGRSLYVTSDLFSGPVTGPSVSVIDVARNRLARTINIGGLSNGLVFSPDGSFAYVTGGRGVSVINTRTTRVVRTIPTPSVSGNIAVSPDGRVLYVDAEYGSGVNSLFIVNVKTGKMTTSISHTLLAPSGLAINSSGSEVVEAFNGGATSSDVAARVVSTVTNRVVATIRTGGGANCVALSPDGKRAYLCNADGSGLGVVSTATNKVIATIHLYPIVLGGPEAQAVAISPNGQRAYVAESRFADTARGSLTMVDLKDE